MSIAPETARREGVSHEGTDPEIERFGEPAWDVARLFPVQGAWTVAEYFDLTNRTNRLVEFSQGQIKVLSMPTMTHQEIVAFLYETLKAFVVARQLGKVLFAGIRVHLWEDQYREPDVLFMAAEHADRMTDDCWFGAGLVMEVVSTDRHHDLVTKRDEYARAGIPEYWIVDPRDARITVLALEGEAYAVHGEFAPGQVATSRLLEGFAVPVAEVFTAKP